MWLECPVGLQERQGMCGREGLGGSKPNMLSLVSKRQGCL